MHVDTLAMQLFNDIRVSLLKLITFRLLILLYLPKVLGVWLFIVHLCQTENSSIGAKNTLVLSSRIFDSFTYSECDLL